MQNLLANGGSDKSGFTMFGYFDQGDIEKIKASTVYSA